MKIVIIGGTGLIGTKLASNLRQKGHEVIAASPTTAVNTITGTQKCTSLITDDSPFTSRAPELCTALASATPRLLRAAPCYAC